MNKVLAIFKFTLKDQIEYPAEIYYWLFLTLVHLFVMVFLWLAIYQERTKIDLFSLSSMITYFFLVMILRRLNTHSAFWISDIVKTGMLSVFLLRPYSFLAFILARTTFRKFIGLIISLPIIIFIGFLLRSYLLFPASIVNFGIFLITVVISMVLYVFLGLILGLVSFWTLEIGSIFYFYYTLLAFLGGVYLPLTFFPKSLVTIVNILPLKYLFHFPIIVYLGQISQVEMAIGVFVGFFWIWVLFILYRFLWGLGLRKYTAFGG